MDFGVAVGYGVPPHPDFWIGQQTTGDGFRESHIAFSAPDRASVQAFFDAAVARGAEVLHAARLWPEYHASYYGAFGVIVNTCGSRSFRLRLPEPSRRYAL